MNRARLPCACGCGEIPNKRGSRWLPGHNHPSSETRFTTKYTVDPSGCWIWTAAVHYGGYGIFWHRGRNEQAHRVAYEMFVGPIPTGMFVCHSCDVRRCVNPAHLWIGDAADNNADRDRKGRQRPGEIHGEDHPDAILTEADVSEIRRSSDLIRVLAGRYGVTNSTIRHARNGRTWKHVTTPPGPPRRLARRRP